MYDPLVDSNIGVAAPYPASYWATTELVNRHATAYHKLSTDIDTDVVVIGGGYTGLSCAYQLANQFSREVTLLEANQIGWVAVSIDDLPRVCQAEPDLFYAAGYCGSGLSFSTQAGKRLAQLCMGQALPALPLYLGPLKPFPLPSLRRLGQQAYYQWGRFSDRFL